jgi:hypothetical protein
VEVARAIGWQIEQSKTQSLPSCETDENLKESTFNITYFAALRRPEVACKLRIQAVLDPVVDVSKIERRTKCHKGYQL